MKRIAAVLFLSLVGSVATSFAQSAEDIALAKLAHSTGNLLLEQILLRRIMIESSGGLADAARHRLAENALERSDYAETIRLLNSGDGAADERAPQVRRDRALIGEAYRRSGDPTMAIQLLNAVLANAPNPAQPDDAALLAARSLDAIGGAIDEAEHFRRAGVYQFNRYWDEARGHYKFVKTTGDAADALFQIGRGYSQSSEYENAIPYYQSVIDRYADTQQAKDALLQLAGAYSRLDTTDQAISLYRRFIDRYPTDEKLDRAYLNIVDIYRDLGDDAHALEWCQKTEAAFAGKTPEALAIFDEAKIHASRSERQDEIAALDRLKGRNDLGGASQPGGTTGDEMGFIRAYAVEQLGRTNDAINEYLSVADGWHEYYGAHSTQRLNALGGKRTSPELKAFRNDLLGVSPPASMVPPTDPRDFDDERFQRANEILREDRAYSLDAIPRYLLEAAFPAPFREAIVRHPSASNVDPRLLLAIMQQESKFDPQARSAAAARGLMQFTHPQGAKIAKELGWTSFSDDELYSPENSIALAAQYLADLNAMFPNQTEAVVASYNGGEDNVKRWMARAKSNEPERYVPELVFGQTKDYVAKVMANYRVYQHLYDEQLRPK